MPVLSWRRDLRKKLTKERQWDIILKFDINILTVIIPKQTGWRLGIRQHVQPIAERGLGLPPVPCDVTVLLSGMPLKCSHTTAMRTCTALAVSVPSAVTVLLTTSGCCR
ncbi:hypothetical protein BG74_02915 [Sodalis-like endosymbiont of Proechinophthirus fluctus]|nr:hypothetical protein BG74_02915 [Sodalis-like endosymbiont of Proechinophthirus fluctus]